MTNIKKKNKNTLLEKEKKLGLILLLPTILIVLSVVIFPLLANFWTKISLQKFNIDIEIHQLNMILKM